ncbi:hypothetical protein V2H45_05045 [Tumidithrix elongata RA019]|uniref:Dual OB-containing domain-containing protein n=1 Tax=Tumidithrix elongata BACA0141 TaxID=2716417 RepID=A0AAW9PUG6_9CYAN|nr:hypothetical protein [Tumidithrix elongata RA019]
MGKVEPHTLIKYCGNYTQILHDSGKYVNPSYLRNLPFQERRTLQLVQVTNFIVEQGKNSTGNTDWRSTIQTVNGLKLTGVKITDPVFVKKLDTGYQPKKDCLVTVSLGMPWAPKDWEGEEPCWKLIAGVIELIDYQPLSVEDLIAETDVEMKRVGWTEEEGRNYLDWTFYKRSRRQLTLDELKQFLNDLKSLPTSRK